MNRLPIRFSLACLVHVAGRPGRSLVLLCSQFKSYLEPLLKADRIKELGGDDDLQQCATFRSLPHIRIGGTARTALRR